MQLFSSPYKGYRWRFVLMCAFVFGAVLFALATQGEQAYAATGTFTTMAKADPCKWPLEPDSAQWPLVKFKVDGITVGQYWIDTQDYIPYSFPNVTFSTDSKIEIVYQDDFSIFLVCDRNVWVDYIQLGDSLRMQAENASSVVFYPDGSVTPVSVETLEHDGMGVNININGTLTFNSSNLTCEEGRCASCSTQNICSQTLFTICHDDQERTPTHENFCTAGATSIYCVPQEYAENRQASPCKTIVPCSSCIISELAPPPASCTIEWHGFSLTDPFPGLVDSGATVDMSVRFMGGTINPPYAFILDGTTSMSGGSSIPGSWFVNFTAPACAPAALCPHTISFTANSITCTPSDKEFSVFGGLPAFSSSADIKINGSGGPLTVTQRDAVSYAWTASGFPDEAADPPTCTIFLDGSQAAPPSTGGSGGGGLTSAVAAKSPGTYTVIISCSNTSATANDSLTLTITAGTTSPVCGNSIIQSPPETCDDGNTASGDGCSSACTIESGWTCSGAPSTCTRTSPPGGGDLPLSIRTGGLVPCGRTCDDPSTTGIDESQVCNFCHLFVLFDRIVDFLLAQLMPVIIVLLIAWGGFLMMTSKDNPGQVRTGREIVTWALLGYGLMLLAWLLVNTFFSALGIVNWAGIGDWWNIQCAIEIVPKPPNPLCVS